MKFKLSSLFFTLVIASLSFGWYRQRNEFRGALRKERETHEGEVNALWGGLGSSEKAHQLILDSRAFKLQRPAQFERTIDGALVDAMLCLWRDESNIDELGLAPATTHGNDILKILKCESPDAFFLRARELGFSGEGFPEFAVENSADFRSLRNFVTRSLNTNEVSDWGW